MDADDGSVAEFFDDTAAYYDLQYDDDQGGDRAFYRDLAREADGPVLEVGVGTGRVYLDLLADGVEADGIDVSAAMLDVLRAKADERGLDPSVWQADVRSFAADREYDLVTVPFRAFLHMLSLDDQRAALASIRDVLAPDGRLALNAFVPDFELICANYGDWREREVVHDGDRYVVRTLSEVEDAVEQVVREQREIRRDGDVVASSEFHLHLASKREFELLFETAGFSDWEVYGGFDRQPLASADQEMVWVVER